MINLSEDIPITLKVYTEMCIPMILKMSKSRYTRWRTNKARPIYLLPGSHTVFWNQQMDDKIKFSLAPIHYLWGELHGSNMAPICSCRGIHRPLESSSECNNQFPHNYKSWSVNSIWTLQILKKNWSAGLFQCNLWVFKTPSSSIGIIQLSNWCHTQFPHAQRH